MNPGSINHIHARPGDIVVCSIPADATAEDAEAAAAAFAPYIEQYPYTFFVVLPENCRLTMLSDDDLGEMGLRRVDGPTGH